MAYGKHSRLVSNIESSTSMFFNGVYIFSAIYCNIEFCSYECDSDTCLVNALIRSLCSVTD